MDSGCHFAFAADSPGAGSRRRRNMMLVLLSLCGSGLLQQAVAADAAQARELAHRAGGSVSMARELADDALMRLRERIVEQFMDRRLDLVRTTTEIAEYLGADGSEPQARRERLRRLTGQTMELLRRRLREDRATSSVTPRPAGRRPVSLRGFWRGSWDKWR